MVLKWPCFPGHWIEWLRPFLPWSAEDIMERLDESQSSLRHTKQSLCRWMWSDSPSCLSWSPPTGRPQGWASANVRPCVWTDIRQSMTLTGSWNCNNSDAGVTSRPLSSRWVTVACNWQLRSHVSKRETSERASEINRVMSERGDASLWNGQCYSFKVSLLTFTYEEHLAPPAITLHICNLITRIRLCIF